MKNKGLIVALVLLFLGLGQIIYKSSFDDINTKAIDVSKYIQVVDDISKNKVQVNWKYIASIISVQNRNRMREVSEDKIKEIANLFILNLKGNYRLNSLENVLETLKFSEKDINIVDKYNSQLEYFGLLPSKLKDGTKYIKFINEIKEEAISNYKLYNVLPSITISQAILESGWGESVLYKKHNNVFGIKADPSWKGESVTLNTSEYYDIKISDKFRKYNDKSESIKDHIKFLIDNPRYKENGVFEAKTYIEQAKSLEDAGYSTVSDSEGNKVYAKRLISIVRQFNLQIIDNQVQYSLANVQ